MKTKKLKYKPEFEFELIGISSSADDYKISWIINNSTNIELQRDENLEILNDKFESLQIFSTFSCKHPDTGDKVKMVSNRSNEGFLIEELKNIDYFLIFYSEKLSIPITNFIKTLKTYPEVSAIFKIDASKLKSKEKLLF